jgi:hypothetical protein
MATDNALKGTAQVPRLDRPITRGGEDQGRRHTEIKVAYSPLARYSAYEEAGNQEVLQAPAKLRAAPSGCRAFTR